MKRGRGGETQQERERDRPSLFKRGNHFHPKAEGEKVVSVSHQAREVPS